MSGGADDNKSIIDKFRNLSTNKKATLGVAAGIVTLVIVYIIGRAVGGKSSANYTSTFLGVAVLLGITITLLFSLATTDDQYSVKNKLLEMEALKKLPKNPTVTFSPGQGEKFVKCKTDCEMRFPLDYQSCPFGGCRPDGWDECLGECRKLL